MAGEIAGLKHWDFHIDVETIAEIPLAVQGLPDKALAGRQIAVWLQPPAVDDRPSPGADEAADARKQRGVEFLNPTIDRRLAARENHAGTVFEQVHGGPAGSDGFRAPFRPAPEPDRIEMRVTDHVQSRQCHR